MKYALNLAEDNRILSATFEEYASADAVLVDELPSGNIADYLYKDGQYTYDPKELTIEKTPSELREEAYNTEKLIDFNGQSLTITEASQLWQYYAAEGSTKANELQVLISNAKSSIREKYPD